MTEYEEMVEELAKTLHWYVTEPYVDWNSEDKELWIARVKDVLESETDTCRLAIVSKRPKWPNQGCANYMLLGNDGRRDWDRKLWERKEAQQDMITAGAVQEIRQSDKGGIML